MLDGFEGSRRLAIFGLLLVCHVYFLHIYPHFISPNETSRLLLTSAIVDDRSLSIDNAIKRFGDTQDKATFAGRYYSDKAIGVSIFGIPAFLMMRALERLSGIHFSLPAAIFWLRLITVTIPSIFFLGFLTKFWARLKPGSKYIPHFAFLHVFGTVAFTYTVQFISHYLLSIFLFCSVYYLNEHRLSQQSPLRFIFLAGVFAGASLLMEFPAFVPVFVICIFAVVSIRRPLRVALFSAPIGAALLLILAYNNAIFGTPWDVTYRHMTHSFHVSQHSIGVVGMGLPKPEALHGLLFSRHHGLFFISPFLLLSIPGFYRLLTTKTWDFVGRLFLAITICIVLVYSGFSYWIGGWNFGPRYITAALPFISTAAFYFGDDFLLRSAVNRILFMSLATWSVLCITIGTITFPFAPDVLSDPIFFLNVPLLLNGATGLSLGGNPWLFFVLLLCTFIVMIFPSNEKHSVAVGLLRTGTSLAFSVLLFTMAHASRPAPSAMEYYARGSVYLYLGKYEQSLSEMYLALEQMPDDKVRLLIRKRIADLSGVIRR